MRKTSLGMVETWGYIPALEAADAGVKAADVLLLGYDITPTALVTVKFVGDVAAVKASVSAAMTAAAKVGKVVASHVIPRPDPQLNIEPPDRPSGARPMRTNRPPAPKPSPQKARQSTPRKPIAAKKRSAPSKGKMSLLKKTTESTDAKPKDKQETAQQKTAAAEKSRKRTTRGRKSTTEKKK